MTSETKTLEAIPTLPALRALGDLAGVRPVVVIDTREQMPLPFARLAWERGTLVSGDYSFRGGEELFAIERKTVPDLATCCTGDSRERFFRELHRLRGFRFKRLLLVGAREQIEAHDYPGQVIPKAVLATLAALEARFDVPVVFVPSPEEAGRIIESWAFWFARELVKNVNALTRTAAVTQPLRAFRKALNHPSESTNQGS